MPAVLLFSMYCSRNLAENNCLFFFLFQKIERLKSALHLIDCDDKPKNKHTIFVDSKKEGMYSIGAELFKKEHLL